MEDTDAQVDTNAVDYKEIADLQNKLDEKLNLLANAMGKGESTIRRWLSE